jgi:putative peptide zinc metalloprotease protein
VLAVLENPEVDSEILSLQGRLAAARLRADALAAMRVRDERAGSALAALHETIRNLDEQLVQRQVERQRLTLVAPIDGVVLPDEARPGVTAPQELGRWIGTPLDPENAGCTLESGETYCLVGDPTNLSANLVVDHADMELVKLGQPVRLWLRAWPGRTVNGTVAGISREPIEKLPAALLATRELAVLPSPAGPPQSAEVAYQVRVDLERVDGTIPIRSTGWAKIEVQRDSLARRLYRFLARTFGLL